MQLSVLTNSAIGTYQKCRRAYRLAYVDGLRKIKSGDALWFGSGVHLGLELLFKGESLSVALNLIEAGMCQRLAFEDATKVAIDIIKAQELVRAYASRWAGAMWRTVSVEQVFSVPILDPATGRETAWKLRGKMDLLYMDCFDRLILVDHKTTSKGTEPGSAFWRKLTMDRQLSLYTYAARRMGLNVEGCIYDVIKKPAIRLRQKESTEAFRTRLGSLLVDEAAAYFVREGTCRMQSEIAAFERELFQIATDVATGHANRIFPRSTDACIDPYECSYLGICSDGGWEPGDAIPRGFEIVANVFPELTEGKAHKDE